MQNLSRRASDGRRSKWRQQNIRDRRNQLWGLWTTDGSAALAVDRCEPTFRVFEKPKTFSICDGLIEILGVAVRFADRVYYNVRFGAARLVMALEQITVLWAHYHKAFKWASGKVSQTSPDTHYALPAPAQPIALLPSGLTAATAA